MLTGLAKAEAPSEKKPAAPEGDAAKAGRQRRQGGWRQGRRQRRRRRQSLRKDKKKDKKKRKGRSKTRVKPNPVEKKAAVSQAERKAAAIASRKPADFVRASETYLFKGSGSLRARRRRYPRQLPRTGSRCPRHAVWSA